ncbi:unnamed protein product, partial [Pylaiella littoralis]
HNLGDTTPSPHHITRHVLPPSPAARFEATDRGKERFVQLADLFGRTFPAPTWPARAPAWPARARRRSFMTAEGTAQDPDAQSDARYLRANCSIPTNKIGLLELITPQNYTMSDSVEEAPGTVNSETAHATTYVGATAATLEAFCDDDDVELVSRVKVSTDVFKMRQRSSRRHLQDDVTRSEAGDAHGVAELISGLQALGCQNTKGEGQILCAISDSFNFLGNAEELQESGELPSDVDVIRDITTADEFDGIDEGSAMIELANDIASGASFKFNTGVLGRQTFADDIMSLASDEGCD